MGLEQAWAMAMTVPDLFSTQEIDYSFSQRSPDLTWEQPSHIFKEW